MNSECDIERASASVSDAEALFYTMNDAVKEVPSSSSSIVFYVREGFTDSTQLEAVQLNFKITPGATITPANGSIQNLRDRNVTYTVTSEDRQWSRQYSVRFSHTPQLETDLSFENFRPEPYGKYDEWFEKTREGNIVDQWATANPGYAISRPTDTKEEYPTIAWDKDSISGHSVKLETRYTGPFGEMVNMRIAAGNLFIGTFDVTYAMVDAMAATRFGLPFNKKPLSFQGYYKFKPGETFQNRKGTAQPGRVDEPDLYAVLYKNTDEKGLPVTLKGDDVLTHPNIVALARVTDRTRVEKDEDFKAAPWTYFDIPFEYKQEIEKHRLENNGYNLAVVFTSSIDGAKFEGAIGSTLLVDEVKVVCEE